MKVYVIKCRSYGDYEDQIIESVFKTYDGAIRHIVEDLNAKHLCDDRYENDDWEFIVTEEEVEDYKENGK